MGSGWISPLTTQQRPPSIRELALQMGVEAGQAGRKSHHSPPWNFTSDHGISFPTMEFHYPPDGYPLGGSYPKVAFETPQWETLFRGGISKLKSGNIEISCLPTQPRHPSIREAALPLWIPYQWVSRQGRPKGNLTNPTVDFHFPPWNFISPCGISFPTVEYQIPPLDLIFHHGMTTCR